MPNYQVGQQIVLACQKRRRGNGKLASKAQCWKLHPRSQALEDEGAAQEERHIEWCSVVEQCDRVEFFPASQKIILQQGPQCTKHRGHDREKHSRQRESARLSHSAKASSQDHKQHGTIGGNAELPLLYEDCEHHSPERGAILQHLVKARV
eukprot:CAMPEP_0172783122 /NCGR_PEP_ID=MMETSP1074-20121228/204273_1 /TAXON_ID=2916 /ORGANISM="Ceratium fusus, Strain PA161109" /LENGTH=150 /DNA_ID=CAMNT_0013620109 /DNA_START=682 /DNA_END=1134 /DNA_ORIENTATION=+